MDDESTNVNENTREPLSREEEWARKAANLVKAGKPQFKRLIAFARPRAQRAGSEAVRYVREHESEIKQVGAKLARSRLRGPLGLTADSLTSNSSPEKAQPGTKCTGCGTINVPAAKFCNECGVRLTPETI